MTLAPGPDATPVRWRRVVCLLSQEELAAAVFASRQTIRSIELGRSIPSVSLALAIARVLDSTVEDLFSAAELR
jgi:putative transcriptional regulator